MISQRKQNILLIRLFPGEDFFTQLEKVCIKHRIKTAVVLSGIGMLQDTELRAFKGGGEYHSSFFKTPMELIGLTGNISKQKDGYNFHIHATLSTHDMRAVGGHLGRGTVCITNEIVLLLTDAKIIRRKEKTSGLLGMFFE